MTVGQIANLPTRSGTNEHNVLGRVVWRGPSQGRGWRCERSKAAGIVSREKFTPPPGSGALTKVTDHPLHSPSESLENAPPFCRFSFPAPGERKAFSSPGRSQLAIFSGEKDARRRGHLSKIPQPRV